MKKQSLEFLKQLLTTPSPSGFERQGQRVWLDYVKKFADETYTDTYGNAVAVLNPGGDPKIMIAGHADEIGLMVNYIDDKGFVYVKPIGGIDTAVLPGKRLTIHAKGGPVRGVTGATAIHLRDKESENKPRQIHEIYIDIGAADRAEAEKRVRVGDPITFVDDFELLTENLAVARAFDDRMGTWVAAETLRLASESKKKPACAIYAASCVQEEIGLRGSHMVTMQLRPDISLVSDVSHATDIPGLDPRKFGAYKLGAGPMLAFGGAFLLELSQALEAVAEKKKIPVQLKALPSGSGTDADSIFKVSGGVATGLLSLPLRYMHTTVEMADLRDLEKIPEVFSEFCLTLKKGQRFKAII